MKILKKSQRKSPKISIILLDWGVRESFHFLHYISKQNIDRELFEVIIIEYYSNVSKAIEQFYDEVDTWALLEMPKQAYYHKHLMYNAGIVLSQGEYIIICDSDAMAKPTFLESVLNVFEKNPQAVLHIDQFRNNRRDFYPFNYPSFEEVVGRGCINYSNGLTTGMALKEDSIHNRNYGACFCARRDLLIKIGGADEHIDFIGHICGPYDLTFRLINLGCKEIWHEAEFLYHTWHPGQAGENNYLGPHDGRHVSSTSLEALYNFRIYPHVENPLIKKLRDGFLVSEMDLHANLIMPIYTQITNIDFLLSDLSREWANKTYSYLLHRGYKIFENDNKYYAVSRFIANKDQELDFFIAHAEFNSESLAELIYKIDNSSLNINAITFKLTIIYIFLYRIKSILKRRWRGYLNAFLALFHDAQSTKIDTASDVVINQQKNVYNNRDTQLFNKLTSGPAKVYKFLDLHTNLIVQKCKNAKKEHKYFLENMQSLIANIRLAHAAKKDINLVISSGNERAFLYIAKVLNLIPKINIIKFDSQSLLTERLFSLNLEHKATILLSRQLYVDNILHFGQNIKNTQYFIV